LGLSGIMALDGPVSHLPRPRETAFSAAVSW
jgi:hypothetical protein